MDALDRGRDARERHAWGEAYVALLDVATTLFRGGPETGDDGLRTSLLAKLAAATDAADRREYDAATGQLGAFTRHVEAQTGDRFADVDAQRLTNGAAVIVDLFPEGGFPPDDG